MERRRRWRLWWLLLLGAIAVATAVAAVRIPGVAAAVYFYQLPFGDTVEDGEAFGAAALFAGHLRDMGEVPLFLTPTIEEYRFTWLRSFHEPLTFHAYRTILGAEIEVKQQEDGTGLVTRLVNRRIGSAEWRELRQRVDRSGFWASQQASPEFGFDGAEWQLEARRGFRFHVVRRWSPEPGEGFRDACLYLLTISGVKLPDDEIY